MGGGTDRHQPFFNGLLAPVETAGQDGAPATARVLEVAVFQYEPDKAADTVVAKLQPFRGTLTADAEHCFNAVCATGRVVEAGCNAHGRRKFRGFSAVVNRRRRALDATSVVFAITFIIVDSSAVLDTDLSGRRCLSYVGREGAPDVPIDNSPTEREFQTVAKLRLNMLFAGRTEGAHRACVLLGIVARSASPSRPT